MSRTASGHPRNSASRLLACGAVTTKVTARRVALIAPLTVPQTDGCGRSQQTLTSPVVFVVFTRGCGLGWCLFPRRGDLVRVTVVGNVTVVEDVKQDEHYAKNDDHSDHDSGWNGPNGWTFFDLPARRPVQSRY